MDLFDSSIFQQYLIIGVVVAIVLGIKFYAVNKSYSKKLDSYVEPDILIPDIEAKLKKVSSNDLRIILNQNLKYVVSEPERMRNIALLIALMKKENLNIEPFKNTIKTVFKTFDKKKELQRSKWSKGNQKPLGVECMQIVHSSFVKFQTFNGLRATL